MAMTYGYVYVASVPWAPTRTIPEAVLEAESYQGLPHYRYAPCINKDQHEQKPERREVGRRGRLLALYRFDPRLKDEARTPLRWIPRSPRAISRNSSWERCATPADQNLSGCCGEACLKKAEKDMKDRFETYKKLAAA